MSVILYDAPKFAMLAALMVRKHKFGLYDAVNFAIEIAECNALAYSETYNEIVCTRPYDAEELEAIAAKYLADEEFTYQSIGGMHYNCVSNCGTDYMFEKFGSDDSIAFCEMLEDLGRFQESLERIAAKKAQDLESFDDIGQQPVMSRNAIAAKCREMGLQRVITATFTVNESDSHTDYFGGRSTRTIVIGFGKGKRESFSQLRKAAGKFPPTANFAPGKGYFKVLIKHANDWYCPRGMGHAWKHSSTHGWEEHGNGTEFNSRQEAEAFIAAQPELPRLAGKDGIDGTFYYDIYETELEHRENCSMGGGNYLGFGRYDGWKISSTEVDYFHGEQVIEIFSSKQAK